MEWVCLDTSVCAIKPSEKTHKSTTTAAIDTNCKLTQSECINIDDDADAADAQ
jgi:hypothetical protein